MIFRQLTSSDKAYFSEAVELLNRTQGRDLFPIDYLDLRTHDENSFVVAAIKNESIISVGVAQLIHDFEFYLPFDSSITTELENKKVGSFSTLCVHEDYQGKGIGQKLSQLRLQWLREKKCEVVLGVSWVSLKAHTSDRVFEKLGFRKVRRVEKFFVQWSLKKPFICPTCGNPPCECAAIMYRLELS